MSPTLTETPAVGIEPPLRPSVWRVGWATFVGYLLTVVVGLLIAIPLSLLGLDIWGQGEGRGAFLHYDVWSWLAEASLGLLATFMTAYFVSDSLRQRTGWEVPFSFAFLTLLLTGYAPLLTLTPFYAATAPVSLVAATLVLRWRAEPSGAEPGKLLGFVPRRYRRWVAIGLAVAAPLMLAYSVAYGVTHPLRSDNVNSERRAWAFEPGKLQRYALYLDNRSPFEATDLSIVRVEGSPVLQLERVGIARLPGGLRPLDGYGVDRDGGGWPPITLELRQGRLCPPGVARLDAVWVRYTVLDGRHEQRIPLERPPAVRCP